MGGGEGEGGQRRCERVRPLRLSSFAAHERGAGHASASPNGELSHRKCSAQLMSPARRGREAGQVKCVYSAAVLYCTALYCTVQTATGGVAAADTAERGIKSEAHTRAQPAQGHATWCMTISALFASRRLALLSVHASPVCHLQSHTPMLWSTPPDATSGRDRFQSIHTTNDGCADSMTRTHLHPLLTSQQRRLLSSLTTGERSTGTPSADGRSGHQPTVGVQCAWLCGCCCCCVRTCMRGCSGRWVRTWPASPSCRGPPACGCR